MTLQRQDNNGKLKAFRSPTICSNNKVYKNINKTSKVKKIEKKLKREQRKLSRKYESLKIRNKKEKGEATRQNIQKQIFRVQKLHHRIDNIRTDYINKCVNEIVKIKPSYITIEDLTGTVEVIIFPRDYEKYQRYLNADEKVFVVGRASIEDEKDGKIICERIVPFDETGCELWFQFATIEAYKEKERVLMDILRDSDGSDEVVIYVANPKAIKRLGKHQTIGVNEELLQTLTNFLGEKNVKVVEKSIE